MTLRTLFVALLSLIFIGASHDLFGQKWIRMLDAASNFYDVQDAFNEEWEGKPYERGRGYKQYKRWEYFMEERTYPTGAFMDPQSAWKEWTKFQNSYGAGQLRNLGTWTSIGPSNWVNGPGWNAGNGRINVVVEDPNNTNTIYVGASSGGLWKSTNGGTTWTALTDGEAVLGVSGIAIDPNNSNTIYIGTGDGDGWNTYSVGVLKSTDGGATWNTTGLNWNIGQVRVIRSLTISTSNSNVLFAATSNGLYRTGDAGVSWTMVQAGSMQDVEIHPTDANFVYTCSDQFFRSTDGGNTFTNITAGLPMPADINRYKIAVSANQPDWVYAVCGKSTDETFEGIYKSTDKGLTFATGTNAPNMFGYAEDGSDDRGQSDYDMAITVNPADANEVYIGGINVWKSTNGGSNFNIITQWFFPNNIGYTHADIHDLAYFGGNLYCGSDGGVYKSVNNGDDWNNISNGITITQFYDIAGTPQNANLMIGGSQDNGTNIYSGTTTWTHAIGADGMMCKIDPTNQNIMYGTIQRGSLRKSVNGGTSFSVILTKDSFPGEEAKWVTPYTLDPADPNTLYVGYKEVYKSTDGGTTWNPISTFGTNSSAADHLEVAPSNSNTICLSKGATLYRTTNGGTTWPDISAGLPNLTITDIAIDPANPDKIWVTFSGYTAASKVYQTTNGGATWTNLTANLPNLPANCIAIQPNSNDVLYVGMDVGVYTKNATQNNWVIANTGLPNVIIRDIEINTGVGKIQLGTYGRGAWEVDIPTTNYCLPTYNNPCTSDDFIDEVVFNTINNTNTGCATPGPNNYTDYTAISTNLSASNNYQITLKPGPDWGEYFVAMIDFNQDNDFSDPGEFFDIGFAAAGGSVTGTITVPANITLGTTRLRVMCQFGNNAIQQGDICGNFEYGEVEDYSVVFAAPACTMLTNPANGATNVPVNTSLTWTAATGNPSGYRIDAGTTPGGTDLLNNVDVGNMTTYDPPGDLPASATIYVKIKPYNANGESAGCAEESFTTQGLTLTNPSACGLTLPVPDDSCVPANSQFPINVTNAPGNQLGTNAALKEVKFIIAHTWVSDLNIKLISPNNVTVELSTGNGGEGSNYGDPDDATCMSVTNLSMTAATSITTGTAPFIGSFIPEGNFADFNDGSDPNGFWKLEICDAAEGDVGMLKFVELVFEGLPACTNLTAPVNGATNVPVNSTLTWAASAGNPTGYRLDAGTTSGGTDILNNVDAGNVTTYDPPGDLPAGETIYVKVKPYNALGANNTCNEESFQTAGGAGCVVNLTINNTNPIPAGEHKSEGQLTSGNSTVVNTTSVIFKSDTGILLQDNFTVELGGVFEALFAPCTPPTVMTPLKPGEEK